MVDPIAVLRRYLAHLRNPRHTQATRPRMCDVSEALEAAISTISASGVVPENLPGFLEWVAGELVARDRVAGSIAVAVSESLRGRAIILRIARPELAAAPKPSDPPLDSYPAGLDSLVEPKVSQATWTRESFEGLQADPAPSVALPAFGIDTVNHASVRIRGFTAEQVQAIIADHARIVAELRESWANALDNEQAAHHEVERMTVRADALAGVLPLLRTYVVECMNDDAMGDRHHFNVATLATIDALLSEAAQ